MKPLLSILLSTFSLISFAQSSNYQLLHLDSLDYLPAVIKQKKPIDLTSKEISLVNRLFDELQFKSRNGDRSIDINGDIGSMTYRRQYLPFLNEHKEKIVWINCFCNEQVLDQWDKKVIVVKGGGNCFFSIQLNLTTQKFEQLSINGPW